MGLLLTSYLEHVHALETVSEDMIMLLKVILNMIILLETYIK